MLPYRQAASVLGEFLPVEPTETHATVRKRTISVGERLDDQFTVEERNQGRKRKNDTSVKCSFPAIAAKSSSSASILLMSAAPSPIQRATSSSLWPDEAAAGGATPVAAIS